MAVRIRLARHGRTHRPFFRVVAIDGRCHREGKANEILGTYDPLLKEKNLSIDVERVKAWVAEGAQISEPFKALLRKYGYPVPTFTGKPKAEAKKPAPKKDGKRFVAASRRAVRRHAAVLKTERKAKLAAEAEAKKAAAPAEAAPAAAEAPKA